MVLPFWWIIQQFSLHTNELILTSLLQSCRLIKFQRYRMCPRSCFKDISPPCKDNSSKMLQFLFLARLINCSLAFVYVEFWYCKLNKGEIHSQNRLWNVRIECVWQQDELIKIWYDSKAKHMHAREHVDAAHQQPVIDSSLFTQTKN